MEKRKQNIIFNKSGAGNISYKISLPTTWINDLEVKEDDREVNIYKLSNKIIITKGEIEIDEKIVLNEVLEECKKELETTGFICDSDNVERFIDNEVRKSIIALSNEYTQDDNLEDYFDDICEQVNDYLKNNYKEVGYYKDNADYVGYFYGNKYDFEDAQELEKHFGLGE